MTTVCEFLNVNHFDSSAQTFVYKVYKDSDDTKGFFFPTQVNPSFD